MSIPSNRVLAVDSKANFVAWNNSIIQILGTTKLAFWPFHEKTGAIIRTIGAPASLGSAETSGTAEALEDDFEPIEHHGRINSYWFNQTGDNHLVGADHADYSHGNGTVDTAFSVGAWIMPLDITDVAVMAKYDSAGNAEEWKFGLDASSKVELELHDASASTSEIGASDAAVDLGQWTHVIVTYDGAQATPEVLFYINGQLDDFDGVTTETGAYVAMEAGATPLTIGAAGVTATPTNEFRGRIALPFQTGKTLSAANAKSLYELTSSLVGR